MAAHLISGGGGAPVEALGEVAVEQVFLDLIGEQGTDETHQEQGSQRLHLEAGQCPTSRLEDFKANTLHDRDKQRDTASQVPSDG